MYHSIWKLGKPTKPKGPLKASDVTKNGCKLKWKKPEDDGGSPIEYYEIEKLDPLTGQWMNAGKVDANDSDEPEAKVTGLSEGKKYKFRVRAVNKEGESEELEAEESIVAKNPYDPPGKTSRPELTDWDKDFVDLKWNPPKSDGGAPIEKYIVQKRDKDGRGWHDCASVGPESTKAHVTKIEAGHEYEFRVVAVNKAGEGEPSDVSESVVAKPRFLAPHIDRTNLMKQTLRRGQNLKLEADVEGEPAPQVTWFKKEEKMVTYDRLTITNEPYHTAFSIVKLIRRDTGMYRVFAKNETGTDEVEIEVVVLSSPSKPKGPLDVSDVTAEGCKLKWEPPEDDGGEPIENYVVERMDTDTGRWVPVCTTKKPEADISGLTEGKEYQFRVRAVNPEGESDALETDLPIKAKNPYSAPGIPGKPKAKDWDRDHVDLTWTKPDSDGGAPITGYIIEKKDQYGSKWTKAAEVTGTKCEGRVTGLTENQVYQFRIRAVNKGGNSKPSEPSDSITAKPRFLAPRIDRTNLKNITIKAGTPLKLDVNVTGEPEPTISWFHNKARLETKDNINVDIEAHRTKVSVFMTTRKNTGTYVIKAENSSGKDEASVEITVLDRPGTPEGPLKISDVHKEGCTLKWTPPLDDGGVPIEHYVVEKMDLENGRWIPVSRTKDPKLDVTNLTPGQEYKFRVSAVNAEGESEPLEADMSIIAKNPFDPPGSPGKPEATDWDRNFVELKWTAPDRDNGAPVTGYVVEKREKGTNRWIKAAEFRTPECKGKVDNLDEGVTYEFRVKAVNEAGPGEPSDNSKAVITKPRKCKCSAVYRNR